MRRRRLLVLAFAVWLATIGRRQIRLHLLPLLGDRLMYRPKVKEFRKHPIHAGDIVFLGDSITYGADWIDIFPGLPVRNFGINGDTTGGVLGRLHQVTAGDPSKIFLLIGTNDLFLEVPDGETMANFTEIVERIRAEAPKAQLFVQSVLPRRPRWTEQVRRLNERFYDIAVERGATWIDLWPVFDDGTGKMQGRYSRDLLHPNATGSQAWGDHIRTLVEAKSAQTK